MRELSFINSLGNELVIDNSDPILLMKFDESGGVSINSYKGINQDGANYQGNTLEPKDITLQILIDGSNEEELIASRDKLNSIFNPKLGEGYLIYRDGLKERQIKCVANKVPYFTPISALAANCLINLTAFKPLWEDLEEIITEIITWLGGFSFPFSFQASFSSKGDTSKNIINYGDAQTPIQITFKGPAINPKVTNSITGEFIRVKRTLSSDDILVINTEFGNKKVEIIKADGTKQNAFNYIDVSSTFFQLNVGDNIIEYSTDGLEPSSVSVLYRNRFIGV